MKITELDLADWKELEENAINQIKTARKMNIIGEAILTESIIAIHKLGGETEEELKKRVKKEKEERQKTLKESTT